jgi:hypothetical protein
MKNLCYWGRRSVAGVKGRFATESTEEHGKIKRKERFSHEIH